MKTRIYAGPDPDPVWEGHLSSMAGLTWLDHPAAKGEARVGLKWEHGRFVQEIHVLVVQDQQTHTRPGLKDPT